MNFINEKYFFGVNLIPAMLKNHPFAVGFNCIFRHKGRA